jgi:hypothetical protein
MVFKSILSRPACSLSGFCGRASMVVVYWEFEPLISRDVCSVGWCHFFCITDKGGYNGEAR